MELSVSKIKKHELSQLMQEEAIKEGWLYSQDDVDFYFENPHNQITAISVNNELAGCVILHESPGHSQGKMIRSAGFFLVKDKYRGQKIVGPHLWQKGITDSIKKDMIVCFHSVPRAVEFYEKLGYMRTSLVNLYYSLKTSESVGSLLAAKNLLANGVIKKIDKSNLNEIDNYNKSLFFNTSGIGFCEFIHNWSRRPDAMTITYYENNKITGYGITTICKNLKTNGEEELFFRISPIYANTAVIAEHILKALVYLALESKGKQIELYSLASPDTKFGSALKEIGFSAIGKNFVVCNHPKLVNINAEILDSIFCSLTFEYPHEVTASLC
jgi:ribosomal protein S18 acetylase RimI-like enzyme